MLILSVALGSFLERVGLLVVSLGEEAEALLDLNPLLLELVLPEVALVHLAKGRVLVGLTLELVLLLGVRGVVGLLVPVEETAPLRLLPLGWLGEL